MVGLSLFLTVSNWLKGCENSQSRWFRAKSPWLLGGIDDPENPLGTDAIQVNQAIASVYSDEGVLMDLGSALMSAEMALEFLPEEQRDGICAKHHSWRARSRQQWRLLLEVSRFWLKHGRR